MYLAMVAHIIFGATDNRGAIQVKRVNKVHLEQSWKNLTQTGYIVLPRNLQFKDYTANDLFRKNDPVSILLGYNGNYEEEFVGYISDVSSGFPLVINVECGMRKLKQVPVNVSYRSVNLQQLIKDIVPADIPTDVANISLGSVRAEKTSVAMLLDKLKEKYGIYSYFKKDTLVVGKTYLDDTSEVTLRFGDNIQSDDLVFKDNSDEKIKLTATSTMSNGDKISVTVGDDEGEEHELAYFGINSEAELKALAIPQLELLKRNRWEGSVTCWGIPFFEHGWKVNLENKLYPEQNGTYYVDATTVTFDSTPKLERKGELGPSAS